MAELEEKLGAVLNNPQAMEQIMALARSLNSASPSSTQSPPPEEAPEAEEGGLDFDPRLMEIGMKALSAYRDSDNSKAALLRALRPFVKEERVKKIDQAVQIAKITKAIRVVLDSFKGGEEGV